MMMCKPISGGVCGVGIKSWMMAATAWRGEIDDLSQFGHCCWWGSHGGPWIHCAEDWNCWKVRTLVRRSAVLSLEGQYFHDAKGSKCSISFTQWVTNCGNVLELRIQHRVVWLSTHTYTGILASGMELITNLVSLAVTKAAVNSNCGKVGYFSGATRDFAMMKFESGDKQLPHMPCYWHLKRHVVPCLVY